MAWIDFQSLRSCGGEPSGNIRITVADDYVRLSYTWNSSHEFDYQVWLSRTPCQYGGSRPPLRGSIAPTNVATPTSTK